MGVLGVTHEGSDAENLSPDNDRKSSYWPLSSFPESGVPPLTSRALMDGLMVHTYGNTTHVYDLLITFQLWSRLIPLRITYIVMFTETWYIYLHRMSILVPAATQPFT
jgi:hypothetical protein